jgi:hypothetical protein
MDTADPSTNGTSASNLHRLSSLLNDDTYATKARQTIAAFESEILQYPWLFPSFMPSIVASKLGVRGIVVAQGDEKDDNGVAKVKDFEKAPRGGLGTFTRIKSGTESSWVRERNTLLESFGKDGRTRILICEGGKCIEEGVFQDVAPPAAAAAAPVAPIAPDTPVTPVAPIAPVAVESDEKENDKKTIPVVSHDLVTTKDIIPEETIVPSSSDVVQDDVKKVAEIVKDSEEQEVKPILETQHAELIDLISHTKLDDSSVPVPVPVPAVAGLSNLGPEPSASIAVPTPAETPEDSKKL